MHCRAATATAGLGYASPEDAFRLGSRETILYVTCTRHEPKVPDYLATVDVDPESSTYCQVIHRLYVPNLGDELHHSGWNACSSCYGDPLAHRSHLVLPGLHSSRIYLVDVEGANSKEPKLDKVIEPCELFALGLGTPHTVHCLADGNIMISTMGDGNGNAKGNFALIDGKTFVVKGKWSDFGTPFGYDFWYQPRLDVMVSSEWGTPSLIRRGLSLDDVANGKYGRSLHIWNWTSRKHVQKLELPEDALMPLEVRFLHEPTSPHGFVGCGLGSSLYHFYKKEDGLWAAEKVYQAEPLTVDGWALPQLPAVITDVIISMDDKYLYASCWLHGTILQFDIINPFEPKLVGQLNFGGVAWKGSGIAVVNEAGTKRNQFERLVIKGKTVRGGPQMLQLSLDGERLYSTTSLYSVWDNQFYPDLIQHGSVMIRVDIDTENGGMKVNPNFLVDFGEEPEGPALAHEMRYPGGDCTSDIWT